MLEILLTIGLLSLIAATTMVITFSFYEQNELINASNLTSTVLRHAQAFAVANEEDTKWGVKYENNTLKVFAGNTYATRDADFDETIILPGSVTVTGLDEVVFDQHYGTTEDFGDVTLTGTNQRSVTIEINKFGNISQL